ncbi:MAG: magnesium-translocating P-type ATPase [Verrucomicrobia bacterium]|nr:magnesium-translocating P-type ATPase [Verrucomicrobiota bacterium]
MNHSGFAFWHLGEKELLEKLRSTSGGLSHAEAAHRLKKVGRNLLASKAKHTLFSLFISQFKSPLILLLIAAAILSLSLRDKTDALIILLIVFASGILSFFQEKGAVRAVEKLVALVKVRAMVLREGKNCEIDLEEVVPGDIVLLSAGDIVPGDCRILESRDCYANEATLTGETFHIEKKEGIVAAATPLRDRSNALFMGSNIVSGTAKALVIYTGKSTEFGKVSEHLKFRPPETSFEKGIRHFGYLLLEVTLMMVIAIFAFNVYLQRPVLESFMFALALAVGLTPQLLPAIISINLSHGAKRMAKQKVIVKRLSSIENIGSMNVFCADKTGTLTHGVIELSGVMDAQGRPSKEVLLYAYLNSTFQSGYDNPIDKAIVAKEKIDVSAYRKLDEIPYDFNRKRLTVLASGPKEKLLISKGAFTSLLDICNEVEIDGMKRPIAALRTTLQEQFERFCAQGFRVIAVAYKLTDKEIVGMEDENGFIFVGFLLFFDPPKEGMKETLAKMKGAMVDVKIITGDHHLVAAHIAEELALLPKRDASQLLQEWIRHHVLTGAQIRKMSDISLIRQVQSRTIFAEVEPNQKERIILALRKSGQVVGFLGDGINDATALHTADVGISVDSAADVAKEVADIVLLKKDLSVLLRGIQEGRRTFANTMKYIFMATSANFGNMFSMAGASLFLPFLPLLPKQILLTNLLTDCPEMTIATDRVDADTVDRPVKWDMQFIRKFMMVFGLISSIFDYMTFGVLLYVMKASPDVFRTGWFIESVLSASMIVLVVRTRKPFLSSRPGPLLTAAVAFIVIVTLLLPFSPLASAFGFVPLPMRFYSCIAAIVMLYIFSAEVAKKMFYAYPKWKELRNQKRLTWKIP